MNKQTFPRCGRCRADASAGCSQLALESSRGWGAKSQMDRFNISPEQIHDSYDDDE
jgi:hypothetical protein